MGRVKICISVSVYCISLNASRIHEIKTVADRSTQSDVYEVQNKNISILLTKYATYVKQLILLAENRASSLDCHN